MLSLLTYLPMHNLHKLTCIPTDEGHCKVAETSVFKPLETIDRFSGAQANTLENEYTQPHRTLQKNV